MEFMVKKEFTVRKEFRVGKEFMPMVGKEFAVQYKKREGSLPHLVRVSHGA